MARQGRCGFFKFPRHDTAWHGMARHSVQFSFLAFVAAWILECIHSIPHLFQEGQQGQHRVGTLARVPLNLELQDPVGERYARQRVAKPGRGAGWDRGHDGIGCRVGSGEGWVRGQGGRWVRGGRGMEWEMDRAGWERVKLVR